jgi:hypothetical protein
MNKIAKTQTAYNFRNTCHKCFNDIEFPLLGDFAYGEMIFQTKDAKDFFIAVLIDNNTFDFITEVLQRSKDFQNKKADPQKILALIADKVDDKEFTTDFPICSICRARQRSFDDSIRTTQIELGFATWTEFESLSQEGKLSRLQEVINF